MTLLYLPSRQKKVESFSQSYLFGERRIHVTAITHQGDKSKNEDSLVVCENLFAVLDGLSVPSGGEFCSHVGSYIFALYANRDNPQVMDELKVRLNDYIDNENIDGVEGLSDVIVSKLDRLIVDSKRGLIDLRQVFVGSGGISSILEDLLEDIRNPPSTTAVALEFINEGIDIYHHGDSLCGFYNHRTQRRGVLTEPDLSPKNRLTHFLGHHKGLDIVRGVQRDDYGSGVTYGLWTDGLGVLSEETIFGRIGRINTQQDYSGICSQLESCASELVNQAYIVGNATRRTLSDNISLILVHVE
ncbi:MAG: hypothetical protein WC254_06485 [Candidatus Woesearchaeota archaeon]|jgi:serine/threonine protein phosphatase PrpC